MTELVLTLPAELVEAIAEAVASRLASSPAPAEPWRLLDLEDAARTLGRSTRWVRDRVRRGELVSVRLDGGALAFELDDLKAFARARRVDGTLAGRLQGGREAHG